MIPWNFKFLRKKMDQVCNEIIQELIKKIEIDDQYGNNFTVTQEYHRIKQIENLKAKVIKRNYELIAVDGFVEGRESDIKRILVNRSQRQLMSPGYDERFQPMDYEDSRKTLTVLSRNKLRIGLSKQRSSDQSAKWRKSIFRE